MNKDEKLHQDRLEALVAHDMKWKQRCWSDSEYVHFLDFIFQRQDAEDESRQTVFFCSLLKALKWIKDDGKEGM